ncbi:MAG: phage tail sheath family protein [Xenococcaceae cyanobacterium]
MPVTPTYPGVYIEEISSGVRTITGVATSITAFIGTALQGLTDTPVRIQSFGEFERLFGGLWVESSMSYAVQQYFLNGGTDAIIIRVVGDGAEAAKGNIGGALNIEAASAGEWGNGIEVVIDRNTSNRSDSKLFNLSIQREIEGQDEPIKLEVFRNLSTNPNASRFVKTVLKQQSAIINVTGNIPEDAPGEGSKGTLSEGKQGEVPKYIKYKGNPSEQTGFYALEQADLFNLFCIPPNQRGTTVADTNEGSDLLAAALKYCKERRAMLIIDPPSSWAKPSDVEKDRTGVDDLNLRDKNAVIYFPEVLLPDPLKENRLESFPPCGVMAGVMARTDSQRGVWKAPAGTEATLLGVRQLAYKMTDGENGRLNPLGVNCLRTFRVYGNVAWGARTLEGADRLASEWKYLPVRRFALFLEESLYRGTQWVVFEPNDEPLWAQIRLNLGAFMNNLFRQGAFQGKTPREAYFVKCDKETTTQNDINLGIVNIIVGFAPLKPAEFVIIKFQQIAGQIET